MSFYGMNYKWTIGLLVIAGVLTAINFGINELNQSFEAESTKTWEGDCTATGLVKSGDGIALAAGCGDFNITTADTDTMLFGAEHTGGAIHCVIYQAGNNDCKPAS